MHNAIREVLQAKGFVTHTIERDATVAEAVARMNDKRVGALIVVFHDRPVGVFTERDVLVRVIAAGLDAKTARVSDVMTDALVSITQATTVEEAMRIMTEWRCRHLPVMDSGKLAGVISIGDLIRWTLHEKEHQIDDLFRYINGR